MDDELDEPEESDAEIRARVGREIRRRRSLIGLTQQQAAARADIGSTTWRELEKGRSAENRSATLFAVARVLEWPIDAVQRMLRGDLDPWGGDDVYRSMDRFEGDGARRQSRVPPAGTEHEDIDYNAAIPELPEHIKLSQLAVREEVTIGRLVAERLVPLDHLAAFVDARSEINAIAPWDVAEEFDVPEWVAMEALSSLALRRARRSA